MMNFKAHSISNRAVAGLITLTMAVTWYGAVNTTKANDGAAQTQATTSSRTFKAQKIEDYACTAAKGNAPEYCTDSHGNVVRFTDNNGTTWERAQ